MFPATAALAWAVLAYICVDFGFLNKVIEISPGNEQIWRAGTRDRRWRRPSWCSCSPISTSTDGTAISATARWCGSLGLVLIAGVAILDPAVAAGIARLSFAATAIDRHRPDRLSRHPRLRPRHHAGAELGDGAGVADRLVDDDHRHARQRHRAAGARRRAHPDHPADRLHRHAARLCRRRAARRACSATWSGRRWPSPAPATRCGTGTWRATASSPGRTSACSSAWRRRRLTGPARNWLPVLHADDRDTFRTTLDVVLEHRRGRISQNFRLRGADGHYHWFSLRARPVIGSDGEVHPLRRHAGRRHRAEEVRGAAAARRRARQSDRPAQPRIVHEPAGGA